MNAADINWLNTAKAAQRLGVTPRTLYRFIDDGQLPAYRFGRVIRLKETEVEEFIERCRITPGTLDLTTPQPTHDLRDKPADREPDDHAVDSSGAGSGSSPGTV